ncbi:MAG: acetoin utilization protein AcuC, partial [archaeon]|nr:acetoin utilization protein AcuC [archaeon]
MTKNVALVYSSKYIEYNFGTQHPLRPIRLELTYKMMESYGLLKNPNLTLIEPRMATDEELCLVHDKEYVEIVKKYSKNPNEFFSDYPSGAYGLGTMDDPVFPGMYEASALVSGATVVAAEQVINDTNNIDYAFNFGGGLHHANHNLAHGFCIFNDISVGIQKVRKNNPNMKIMYLDIDAHHGDGTQWIFYDDPNVLTLSIHQDG